MTCRLLRKGNKYIFFQKKEINIMGKIYLTTDFGTEMNIKVMKR